MNQEQNIESAKIRPSERCLVCGALTGGAGVFCPKCRSAARSSGAGSDSDDTEGMDLAQLQESDSIITEKGMSLVYIPPGESLMGSKGYGRNETPPHFVYIDGFHIGRLPVTNWQYHEFMKDTGQKMPAFMQKPGYNDPDQPVVGVSWQDAFDYCKWFSRRTKKRYSLPTEAQWEKAARGPEGCLYPWGNTPPSPDKAHYVEGLSPGPPAQVITHLAGASPFGCLDMVGNIWEWTGDTYSDSYFGESDYINPEGPITSKKKVLKGGGRAGKGSFLRCARRIGGDYDLATNQTGFRVARAIEEEELRSQSPMKLKYEARTIVRQAKTAISHNRRHQAITLLEKALALNPGNRNAKQLLNTMPKLPKGLEPAKNTEYHPATGLPLRAFCEWTGSTMVLVPEGKFIMGRDAPNTDEVPAHEVYLESFYIDTFEVTNEMFAMFLDMQGIEDGPEARRLFEPSDQSVMFRAGRWAPAAGLEKHPMVCITWKGAQMFADWTGMALPTEAQWEKAARGADGRLYPWGNKFTPDLCNCKQSGILHTTPVNKYEAGISPYGCWDMAGNVWEWCYDWYNAQYYAGSPAKEPLGPPSGEMKVLRSGGWGADASSMHCSARYYAPPEIHIDTLGGFRCVKLFKPREVPEETKSLTKKITKVLNRPIIGKRHW